VNPGKLRLNLFTLLVNLSRRIHRSIGMSRTIPATIMDSSGNWTQNPELNWSGNWVPDGRLNALSSFDLLSSLRAVNGPASPPGMLSHPLVLSYVSFNVTETSEVYIYGLPSSYYSINIQWNSE
jgi:hypothetical protein